MFNVKLQKEGCVKTNLKNATHFRSEIKIIQNTLSYNFKQIIATYGAIMALAGPNVDCACDNQPSSCAFSWDPKVTARKKKVQITTHQITTVN